MKRLHLNKMSTLLESLEVVARNAKNKGHRSGFRCHEIALQLADQFEVFKPTIESIITNREQKNNPFNIKRKWKGNDGLSRGEFEVYKVIRDNKENLVKIIDVYQNVTHKKAFNTIRQYVNILKQKGYIQAIKIKGERHKFYKAYPLSFNTQDRNLVNKLSS
jgi:hypothetical protein